MYFHEFMRHSQIEYPQIISHFIFLFLLNQSKLFKEHWSVVPCANYTLIFSPLLYYVSFLNEDDTIKLKRNKQISHSRISIQKIFTVLKLDFLKMILNWVGISGGTLCHCESWLSFVEKIEVIFFLTAFLFDQLPWAIPNYQIWSECRNLFLQVPSNSI